MKPIPFHFIIIAVLLLSITHVSAVSAKENDPIAGRWSWFEGGTVELSENGHARMASPAYNMEGQWTLATGVVGKTERQYVINWQHGQWIDTIHLSNDQRHLYGQNQVGMKINATRILALRGAEPPSQTGEPTSPVASKERLSDAAMKQKILGYWTGPRWAVQYKSDGLKYPVSARGEKCRWDVKDGVYYEEFQPGEMLPCDILVLTDKKFVYHYREGKNPNVTYTRISKERAEMSRVE